MIRRWSVSIYCHNEHQLLLARNVATKTWEPLSGRLRRGESPLGAAVRVGHEHVGRDLYFPPIHQVLGAPQGLLLYHEYAIDETEARLNFVFLAELSTRDFKLSPHYDQPSWVHDDHPFNGMPHHVRGTLPFALMAAGLVRP